MKAKVVVFFACSLCVVFFAGRAVTDTPAAPSSDPAESNSVEAPATVSVFSASLHFIPNGGQSDARALFRADASGYVLWLTRGEMIFSRVENDRKGRPTRSVSRLIFIGASRDCEVIAADPSDYRVSYFYGRDESEWKTDIPTTKAVLFKNIYDGIDLKIYGTGREVEYDWIVAPGARPEQIRFAYSGDAEPMLDEEGNLAIENAGGRVLHRRPNAYQTVEGRRVEVRSAFKAIEGGAFGFEAEPYDSRYALTVDPLVLSYSTYLGGRGFDRAAKVAVDPTGAVYVCGQTDSRDFPPGTQDHPREDQYVTKLSPDGRSLIYTAFFPSSLGNEWGGLAVDKKGFVYLTGTTTTAKFPVKNAFQPVYGGGYLDGFVLKLDRTGKGLVYSSYIGGGDSENCRSIDIDAEGAAFVGGWTKSLDLPTKNAYQKKNRGGNDAFIAKVAPDGRSLVFCTYLGSTGLDELSDIVATPDGAVVVGGQTKSPVFPLLFPFQKVYGGRLDAFVAKVSPAGNKLVYSSYLGGSRDDVLYGLAADASGSVYAVGRTPGTLPVKNAFQPKRAGAIDGFVTKISPDGRSLVYSSFLGGSGDDYARGVAVDGAGNVHIVGETFSRNFPLKSPYQTALRGNSDCFLVIVDAGGRSLVRSTYLGGLYEDLAIDIALDARGSEYVCGFTNSKDFPVKGAYQNGFAGGSYDGFVLKFKAVSAGLGR